MPEPLEASNAGELTGLVVLMDDPRLNFAHLIGIQAGTQKELAEWQDRVRSENVSQIVVSNMSTAETELTSDQIKTILQTLQNADFKLYNEPFGNPPTGGASIIVAYNLDGNQFWRAIYNGAWLVVAFDNDDNEYVFNAEETFSKNPFDNIF